MTVYPDPASGPSNVLPFPLVHEDESGDAERGGVDAARSSAGDQRDQAGAHRDQAGDRRDLVAHRRDVDGVERDRAGDQRDREADRRDREADERDEEAERRDLAAELSEMQDGSSDATGDGSPASAREEAAADRRRASQDRGSGAWERSRAGLDRDTALADRGSGASERSQAELDRNIALADRDASARDREPSVASPVGPMVVTQPDGDVQLGLLGAFSLQVMAEPISLPMNAQRLVSFLALNEGLLLRQHVAGSLWGDTSEHRASGSLRSELWRLGHHAHPLVDVVDPHLRLSPIVAVDFRASEALAHRILDVGQELREADFDGTLLTVDLLPDWTEDWVLVKREYHAQLRLRALEALCARLTAMGRSGQAVQAGLQAVSGEPLRESAQRALVSAHIAEGNVAAALAQYDTFRDFLRVELDLEPSAEMQTLIEGHR